jgi:CRP-like cAMP-binding protein
MSIDEDIAILEQAPMLRVLGRGALRLIAMGAESRPVAEGEVLFRPQDKPDCAFVVQSGSFRLSIEPEAPSRNEAAGPGTLLGEFALLSATARPLCAIAQEPSMVMRISRSMFTKILEDDAQAAVRLREFFERRIRKTMSDMLVVRDGLDPSPER